MFIAAAVVALAGLALLRRPAPAADPPAVATTGFEPPATASR